MKIFVSPQMFSGPTAKFREPLREECGVYVDYGLRLGQLAIETDDGRRYLVESMPEPPAGGKRIRKRR